MNTVLIIFGLVIGSAILLPFAHLAVWALIPPLSPHALAKQGGFVSVDGVDTYYERYGSGPPIILIPPGGGHTSTWRYNIAALSRSHEVWTLDLPGSGYTAKPASFAYTHRSFARFVRDFMNSMGIPKAAVAGQSLGGTIALEFALDYPDRTAGLVLIDQAAIPARGQDSARLNPLRYPLINAILMSFSSYPPVVKSFYSYLYYDRPVSRATPALVSEICAINRTPNARNAFYWLQRGLEFDFALPDLTPHKVGGGADADRMGTRGQGHRCADRGAPSPRYRWFADRRHRWGRPHGARGEAGRREPRHRLVSAHHRVVSRRARAETPLNSRYRRWHFPHSHSIVPGGLLVMS